MAAARYPILVLGGYGVFGAKICRRLAKDPAIRLIAAGRSLAKAQALVSAIRTETPDAEVEAKVVVLPLGLAAALGELKPRLVIHNAGPFQGQDYAVPMACIEAGVDYLDLADDRQFVAGFDVLEAAARAKDVLAVSGVSTLPGLSSTVVAMLKPRFNRMRRIAMGIVPANRMPRGLAVVEARNQLFSLFTLNRPSYQFVRDELVRAGEMTERSAEAGPIVGDALERMQAHFRMDLPPVRRGKVDEPGYDEVLSRTHNPLTLRTAFEAAGFRDVRVLFYHFHALPPMFEAAAPAWFLEASVAMERVDDWRGYFMASAFVLVGTRA